ncbi:MAG TPA: CopG family transcriptional regulator [Burkholderiaceae bacterium]|nr:CopG family transcriptional regulator [Burkholderiaceae bacterium]
MNVVTLKIPEDLDAALRAASKQRGLSRSAVVREALEQSLGLHEKRTGGAARWASQWRGRLSAPAKGARGTVEDDARLAHLLAKHLR